MINLDTLDSMIAIVIVLLILSLIVQSIQAALKKFFKLKSRQIEESLVDLFENVLGEKSEGCVKRFRMPTLLVFRGEKAHPSSLATAKVKKLFDNVMTEFQEIGRVSGSRARMFDSISKSDLMKVLRRVAPDSLLPDFVGKLEAACRQAVSLKTAIEEVACHAHNLSGESSARFARLRASLTPMINDVDSFFKDGNTFNPEMLLDDVLKLREIDLGDALDLLGEVQKKVEADLAAARQASQDERVKALETVSAGLQKVAASIAGLRVEFDKALAPMRLKLNEVEIWYDTVMRSFEERYERGMKTYALVISFIVAVCLNANIFGVYRDITTQPEKRAAILRLQDKVTQSYEKQLQAKVESGSPAEMDEAKKSEIKRILDQAKNEIDQNAAIYGGLDFTPLSKDWERLWQGGLWSFTKQVFYMLFGWALMAALLSIGAPFWHDALKSLFGVKNLLRKRGETRNVEQETGVGKANP